MYDLQVEMYDLQVMDSKCDLLPTDKTLNVGDVLAIHCVGTQWSVFLGGTPSTIKQKIFHLKNIMIDDIVNFAKDSEYGYVDFYNSQYQLHFTDYTEGHFMEISKLGKDGKVKTILKGYYTADSGQIGFKVSSVAQKDGDGETTIFADKGWKEDDMVLIYYATSDDGISLNIDGIDLKFNKPVEIAQGTWKTPEGGAKFEFGSYWGYYSCYDLDSENDGKYAQWRLYLMLGRSINQFDKTIRFRVSYAYDTTTSTASSCKIMLPSQQEITVDCKDYTVPFTYSANTLTFTLFGYTFVLRRTGD